jgi:hypothetical protein
VSALTPVREAVEKLVLVPERWDIFLCHAWDDRAGAAKELHDLLVSRGVKVWFSEKDVALGTPLLREIDKGLAKSRIGLVLVTPALLRRLQGESIADKELSVLLARDQLVYDSSFPSACGVRQGCELELSCCAGQSLVDMVMEPGASQPAPDGNPC